MSTASPATPNLDAAGSSVSDRLIAATAKLLAEKGIRSTTVAQVAEIAGVSRAWLYRHFPDKQALVGATIVRLTDSFWTDAQTELDSIDSFAGQLAAGVRIGRGAYDDPGALLMRLRTEEPDEFHACAGAGVAGLVPDLALFWLPYVERAAAAGDIHPDHDLAEVAEWVARNLISLGTMPGRTVDPDVPEDVSRYVARFMMPALVAAPT